MSAPKKIILTAIVLALSLLAVRPARAYHPLSTDDPGTTEFRHFELEWGNDLIWPEGGFEESSGYLAIKAGLAPGLEFDTALGFAYFMDADDSTSGFGDSEIALKYRFLGDGDGPTNMGIEVVTLLPAGEVEKGLSEGDTMVPTVFLFGTVGTGDVRVLMNAGTVFAPVGNDLLLYGTALEWATTDKLTLVGEVHGEADLELEGDESLMMARLGALYVPAENVTLSAGLGTGFNDVSPDVHFNFAVLLGW